MISGNETYISILVSGPMLMSVVGIILSTIALLKKGKQYTNQTRCLMIALLTIASGVSLYLVYLAFAFGNPHPPASPIPLD